METPGVVMTSRGPGIANAMDGVAYATLDRVPLRRAQAGHDARLFRPKDPVVVDMQDNPPHLLCLTFSDFSSIVTDWFASAQG
jgi:TPP-dependent trihydroxycyclohexane-1,2-dione (THcHDO) dehydratase